MKKIIYSISVFLTCAFLTRNANATWPDLTPAIPVAPQLCVMCVPPAISTAVSYIDQAKALRDDLKKYTDMTVLKQMAVSYASDMGATAFNKWKQNKNKRKKVITYARTIEDSTIADITDEASVKDAFIKLFLQYPSKKSNVKEAYKTMGEQLKMDTTVEIYLTSVEMEKELYGKAEEQTGSTSKNMEDMGMLKQIDLIEGCLVEGKDCDVVGLTSCQESAKEGKSGEQQSSSGGDGGDDDDTNEDQVCFWNSALQAERLYDTIMKYNLMLVAMHAQYQAVTGINQMAQIKEYEEDEEKSDTASDSDKTSWLEDEYLAPSNNTAYGYISAEVSFADLTPEEEQEAEEELKEYEENLAHSENVIDGNFEDANNPESFTAALDEKEDDVKSLNILREVQEELNKAQKVHNLKHTLPEFKKVYEDYDDAQKKMDLAVQNLEDSGQCIVNMLKPYYEDANKTWFGDNCSYYSSGQIICHYQPERVVDSSEDSEGLFDTICPGDATHSCYVMSANSENMENGVAKYLLTLYSEAKDEDAAGDTEASIGISETTNPGGYSSSTEIILESDNEEKTDEDELFMTSKDESTEADDTMLDEMTTQTSDTRSGEAVSTAKDQEKADEEKENARKDSLIRWIIGSEVSKELALDLDTGENEWGDRKGKFPLWVDQIFFYNQYIDGKYDNIKEYINTMSPADVLIKIASNLNPTYPYQIIPGIPPITAEQQRQTSEEKLKKLENGLQEYKKDLFKQDEITDENPTDLSFEAIDNYRINKAIERENNRFEELRQEYSDTRAAKEQELHMWYGILNEANTKRSELNQEYNKNNEIVKTGESTTPQATDGLEYGKGIYEGRNLSKESPQNQNLNATKTASEKAAEKAKVEMADIESKIEKYEKIAKQAEEKIAKIKEDLEKMRTEYVKKLSDAESAYGVEFAELVAKVRASRQIDVLSSAVSEIEPLDLADRLVKCIREYSLSQVTEAKGKIDALKQDNSLYYVESAPKVHEIHQKMIQKITNIKAEDLVGCAALNDLSGFSADTDESILPALNIFADICKDNFCTTEDEEYFVGAVGLSRDFSAPKSPVNFSSAPVREIFHFDIIDFINTDKYYKDKDDIDNNRKIFTSAESFLNFLNNYKGLTYEGKTYASTVPEIWTYILKRHAFVQKQIDLAQLLGENDEVGNQVLGDNETTLLRSGVFPCINEGYVIDVAHTDHGPLYYNSMREATQEEEEVLPQCQGISVSKKDGRTIVDDNEAGGGYIPVENDTNGIIAKGSELGTILAYITEAGLDEILRAKILSGEIDKATLPHRLTFNNALLKAISIINKTEDLGKNFEEDIKFHQASRAMYERNQFGDFLDYVENEKIVKDTLEKIENQITDIRRKLEEVISTDTFEISDEFNLLNEDDYQQAEQVLEDEKNLRIDMALQKLQSLPKEAGKSQNIRDKYERLMHKIAVLQKDSQEVVAVNGTEELDELEEKIKNKEADSAVANKYDEAKRAEEKRMREHYRHPYCASYQY